MEEWKECTIGDVCNTISDTYRGNAKDVVLINTSDVLEGKCLNHQKTPNKNLKGQFKKTFQQGDILYSEIRPANKRYAYVNFAPKDYIASTKLMVIRHNDKITPQYLFYILTNDVIIRELQMIAESRSGTFPQVTFSELANFSISLPSISQQKEIVAVLKSFDSKIDLNRRINDNLERQAQALFKSWFVDFEPFKKGKFIDSELGMIPEGWQVEELGNITNSITEKVGKRTDIKVLSPVNTGDLLLSEEYFTKQVYSKNLAKYIMVAPNDFAYNPARINIGSIGMNTFDFSGCVSPVYVVFRCEKEYHHFFNIFKATKNFKEEVNTRAIGGVRQTLSYKDFSLIKIVYPPKEAVERFNKIYSHIMTLIKKNVLENKRLHQTRDTLLPKLMSGELKINDINN